MYVCTHITRFYKLKTLRKTLLQTDRDVLIEIKVDENRLAIFTLITYKILDLFIHLICDFEPYIRDN